MSSKSIIYELVNNLGKDYLIKHVDKVFDITYKKCNENIEEKYPKVIFETNYENNLDNAINSVNNSIQLKAVDHIDICSLILEIMNPSFKELLMEKADYIIIQSGKYPILKIVNNKNPKSGIYINCDVQYLQSYLECENLKRYNIISILIIGSIVGCFIWKNMF